MLLKNIDLMKNRAQSSVSVDPAFLSGRGGRKIVGNELSYFYAL